MPISTGPSLREYCDCMACRGLSCARVWRLFIAASRSWEFVVRLKSTLDNEVYFKCDGCMVIDDGESAFKGHCEATAKVPEFR